MSAGTAARAVVTIDEVVTAAAQDAGATGEPRHELDRRIDAASEASFPSSDPPSWWAGRD